MSAPPPPPPHGEVPKSSGLPPGKYDIFVIPEHSAGSGFLYLPSLQPNVNSFVAGFASALILVVLFQSMAPAFRAWWDSFQGLGSMGITMLILGVGFGAWALGRTQKDSNGPGPGPAPNSGSHGGHGGFGTSNAGATPNAGAPPPPPPPPPHSNGSPGGPQPSGQSTPKPSWQQRPSQQPGTSRTETPKGSWEKAREETRKKEEERKAKEAEQKRREETARRLAELRAKEAKERLEREKEKERREKEARDLREKIEAERRARELAEKLEKEKKEAETRKGSSYAFSGVGEKTSMWPNGRPAVPSHGASPSSAPPNPSSPNKKPPAPTARTYLGTDDDAYSYRPYDQPKRPKHKKSASSLGGSESSWAASQTTARTTPPPSARGPYTTKDPDKIVVKAVYLFMNQFAKTPASQLISGFGSVTDGLILRITTEGLFIDDDVRGVPQREWDVKAWTLKLVEVWCPPHCLNSSASAASAGSGAKNSPNLLHKMAASRARQGDRGVSKSLTGDEADAYLTEMLHACKDCCRLGLCERTFKDTNIPSPTGQTGEWKSKGLHVLRATIRDQDGKRFFFVVDEPESWKIAAGLQRLRRGAQARQLGVSGMTGSEARMTLEMLGWT